MIDIIIVNLDTVSYLCLTLEKDLAKVEKEKKVLYLQDFMKRRRTFTPIVYSADVIPGAEDLAAQQRLAALLSYKLKWEYSDICGFLKATIGGGRRASISTLIWRMGR